MARITYEVIMEEGMTDEVVCKALHVAMKNARDSMLLSPAERRRSTRVASAAHRNKNPKQG